MCILKRIINPIKFLNLKTFDADLTEVFSDSYRTKNIRFGRNEAPLSTDFITLCDFKAHEYIKQ